MAACSEIRRFASHAPGSLIAANCIVFIAVWICMLMVRFAGGSFNPAAWLALPSQGFLHMPWTLLTYMFTQYNPLHLLFNMIWLWWFGSVLLLTLPQSRIVAAYIGGGITGALAFIIYGSAGYYASLTGSSAAVIAVMTLAAFRSPDYEMNLLFFGTVRLKWIAVISVALIFLGSGTGNTGGAIAHIGGLAWGIVCGAALRNGKDILAHFCKLPSLPHRAQKNNRKMRKGMQRFADDTRRLDMLLDKIRISGYGSLTDSERRELKSLSESLNRK